MPAAIKPPGKSCPGIIDFHSSWLPIEINKLKVKCKVTNLPLAFTEMRVLCSTYSLSLDMTVHLLQSHQEKSARRLSMLED